jgi:hypothetical protein
LALFLAPDLATMLCSCRSSRHGLAVEACFAHAVAEKGASSCLVGECTPRHRPSLPHTRLCRTAVTLSAATFWRRPELRHGLHCPASLRPTSGLSQSRSHPYARAHPSTRPRTQVRAHPHRSGCPTTCRVPPPRRRRRANTGVDLTAPVTSFLGRVPSSPSDPRGSHESSQMAGCPGAVRTRRRRDHPAPSVPLRHCVEHLGSRLKPWGCFAHGGPHVVVAVANPPGSGAARHSPLEPHDCLHRAALQRIPPGSCATGHASSHTGCSWLKATDVAASSALVAGLQPASS